METFFERQARIRKEGRLLPLKKAAKYAHMIAPARKIKTELDHRGRQFIRGSRLMWTFNEPRTGGHHAWRAGAAIRSLGYRPVMREIDGVWGHVWINCHQRFEFHLKPAD
jgi:hypothetical protein